MRDLKVKVEIAHTWRSGVFSFRGEIGFSDKIIGALIIFDRNPNLESLIEVRHRPDTSPESFGHFLLWNRNEDREPVNSYLGGDLAKHLLNYLPDGYQIQPKS